MDQAGRFPQAQNGHDDVGARELSVFDNQHNHELLSGLNSKSQPERQTRAENTVKRD